ncbi:MULTISPECIES: hypothetical protein [unclassified Pseudomonas]|uniref:hypothetical protein n=1 Tax=unclassified Pseudomonas TaxID=196821 RepID=UPI001C49C57F|nr:MULTISPECIES: hypothetical protein [unclassified Pseudomonas]
MPPFYIPKRRKTTEHQYPAARILGHRDLSPDLNNDGKITPIEFIKACPSFDVATWLTQN